jgi:DNA-directed RNA polymerase sigma subunit (sigma70/sigma32)
MRKSGGSRGWTGRRIHAGQALARGRCRDAAHQLVTSHLRLVAKVAQGYRGYGLPIADVISEAMSA